MKKLLNALGLLMLSLFLLPTPASAEVGATYSGTYKGTVTQTIQGQSNSYDYTLIYAITFNDNGSLTFKTEYNWIQGSPLGMPENTYAIIGGYGECTLSNGEGTTSFPNTFTDGQQLTIEFKKEMQDGLFLSKIDYTVGSTSDGSENPGGGDEKPGGNDDDSVLYSYALWPQSQEGCEKSVPVSEVTPKD